MASCPGDGPISPETTARLAVAVDPAEGERLVAELRGAVRLRLEELLAPDGPG